MLQLPGWRKLGGRLRKNKEGNLEIHVPPKFTDERPAVGFAYDTFDICLHEHPLASQLPDATETGNIPIVLGSAEKFRPLAIRPGGPSTPEDWLYSDDPQLSVYVVGFTDVTLVSVAWPHTAMDAMGLASLLRAWTSILNSDSGNSTADVPPCKGETQDPLLAAKEDSVACKIEIHPLASQRMGILGMIGVMMHFLMDMLLNRTIETRTICLPARFVAALKQSCCSFGTTATIKDENDEEENFPVSYISTADSIGALLVRLTALRLGLSSNKPINVFLVTDIRKRLPSLLDPKAACLQNLVVSTNVTTPLAKECICGGVSALATVAKRIRREILRQTPEPKMLWLLRELIRTPGIPPMFGSSHAALALINHWSHGGFMNEGCVDFTAAVVGSAKGEKGSGISKYMHSILLNRGHETRHGFIVYGRDERGNYWADGFLTLDNWKRVETELVKVASDLKEE